MALQLLPYTWNDCLTGYCTFRIAIEEANLVSSARPKCAAFIGHYGFSIIELVAALTVILILAAVALPDFSRAYRIYQLNSNATRLAGLLKITRSEAIRRNYAVDFQVQQTASGWLAWCDTNNDGIADSTETQDPVVDPISLLPAGVPPSPDAITALLGALTPISGGNATISFDARGAVVFGGQPQAVYVLYLGNATNPDFGYRAVVILPSGIIQVWSAPAGGPWNRIG